MTSQRLPKIHRKAAIFSVLSEVRIFLEDNPNFIGEINLRIDEFNELLFENLELLDNDHVQRLNTAAFRIKALSNKEIQEDTRKLTVRQYPRVESIDFNVSKNHAAVHINVSTTARSKEVEQ